MAQGPNGYYVAFQVPPQVPPVLGQVLNFPGVPPSSLGTNGDMCINLLTGKLYSKSGNVWGVVSGSGQGGAVQIVYYTTGNPNPPDDPTAKAIAVDPNGNLPSLVWNTGSHLWK